MDSIKRNILSAILILIITSGAYAQESGTGKFNQGVTYFSAGSYNDALQSWTEVYNTGYRSAALCYNIGNAYFKLNNIPQAILFYERAYLLKPADEDINYNLQIARTLIVDRFQEIPELFFVRWYNFVSLFLSSNQWARISIVSFILSLLFLSLYIYSLNYRHKVIGFWFAVSLFIISLGSFVLSSRNKYLVHDSHQAVITNPVISGKSSPDSSGTDLFVLHEGTKVSVEDEVGEWLEIRLSDGNKGWVPLNSLNII
ncbi:MAG: tetratricopeptide repeat protein [Bacteroidales bacterium]|nr:tetratricopeptide repeat protein [Bacteroidales bacterium]MBK8884312.1 tetratricopeptide repeat protein [Bacteroidales bacterium]